MVDSQNLYPRAETSNTREHTNKARGGKLNGDVWGKCLYTESSGDLEGTASGGGGGKHNNGV